MDLLSALDAASPERTAHPAVLDLGCGLGDARVALESMGFDWVGIDLPPARAPLLADAHALPFGDQSFNAVFSLAVLEHLHNPFLAMVEVRRVLAAGAPFVGVVAFGEPFHASFFHMSAWGVLSLLHATGFTVKALWPCRSSLAAQADMGGFPRVVRGLLRAVDAVARIPALSPRRWLRDEAPATTRLATAGSLGFLAIRA